MAPDGRRGSSNRGRGRPRGSGRGVTNTRRSTRSATTNPGITKKKSAMEQQLELLKKQIADLSASVATVVPASDNSVRSFSPLSSRVRIENSGKSGKSASLQHRLRDLSPVSDPDKSISHVSAKCRFEPHASAGKYLARALRLSPDVSLNSLDSTINKLRSNHIATSSRKTYQSALNRFIEFCRKFRLSSAHITKSTVLRYVAFLFESGLSYSSAKVYLSALFNAFRECGLSFEFNAPNISQCLIGYKRLRGTVSDRRLPITIDHMRIMKLNIDCSSLLSPYEKQLYWSMFTLCFFAFLRIGEIIPLSGSHFILFKDVSYEKGKVYLHLRSSKTDQYREGCRISLQASGRSVCAVRAMRSYLALRKSLKSPHTALYLTADGLPVQRCAFTRELSLALHGVPNNHLFTPHSFRIGAASSAAANGTPFHDIQRAGRWRSDAYASYIRQEVPLTGISLYPKP
ncbi:uncharacterized protein LOC129601767 [Paramacrobiotus metropolitanus]|uniref:uncharacterized protein LOC129601767 n=1 Tax=Paramacrobiotus metropolitanus TaxID=2943436 RepID=UPI002445ADB2|nr:uncharacterized protein LOC129601767 [Paramacrobiotus metropolitanus]